MQRDNNRGEHQMDATTTQAPGEQKILATYQTDTGTRQLIAQRVKGTVALSDIPTDDGKVYLVERELHSLAELEALVTDYVGVAHKVGRCPMLGWLLSGPSPTGPPSVGAGRPEGG
jgi:hypothetical protein